MNYFLYQLWASVILLIFFCNCRIPYINASAVGGQPRNHLIISITKHSMAQIFNKITMARVSEF